MSKCFRMSRGIGAINSAGDYFWIERNADVVGRGGFGQVTIVFMLCNKRFSFSRFLFEIRRIEFVNLSREIKLNSKF